MSKFKCGCIAGHYWCSKHDIYIGNVPPWGAGQSRASESKKVFDAEIDFDKTDIGCSCHLSAPCGYCERTQSEE